jgi:predicted O-methyltransferase YrrM
MSRLSRRYVRAKAWENYLRVFVNPPRGIASLPGYLHPLEGRFLHWLGSKVPANGLALEVGSFKGKSASFIASGLGPTARLACVDTWRNDAMPYDSQCDVMSEFLRNTDNYRDLIETHRGTSAEVAEKWSRTLDVLFIDGDHSYQGCSTDMKAWMPFVRQGGWVAFHDSSEEGVDRAIRELFPKSNRRSDLYAWSIFAAVKLQD